METWQNRRWKNRRNSKRKEAGEANGRYDPVSYTHLVKKQAFQLIKISEDGDQTETDLVEGAGFQVYLVSSLSKVEKMCIRDRFYYQV